MDLDSHLDVSVADGVVAFAFSVENTGTKPVELTFRSGKRADVVVSEDGVEVWRWSRGRLFTQALRTEALAPGESVTQEMTWDDPRTGEYTAEGSLAATETTLVDRTTFAVA